MNAASLVRIDRRRVSAYVLLWSLGLLGLAAMVVGVLGPEAVGLQPGTPSAQRAFHIVVFLCGLVIGLGGVLGGSLTRKVFFDRERSELLAVVRWFGRVRKRERIPVDDQGRLLVSEVHVTTTGFADNSHWQLMYEREDQAVSLRTAMRKQTLTSYGETVAQLLGIPFGPRVLRSPASSNPDRREASGR